MHDHDTDGHADGSDPFWDPNSSPTRSSEPRPSRIGRYRIVRLIGHGGMGSVYEAEQDKPLKRRVAVKIIKPGMDSKSVIARFEAERQALALMDHPGVAKVFDAGSTEQGRPYFVMEYVSGRFITAYCDQHRLSIKERLVLFSNVCRAVQHAHQKGIIHRDIKPSNVLVSEQDGEAVPRVIDFGLAKALGPRLTEEVAGPKDIHLSVANATEKTADTELGQVVGTPGYMSPEQARGDADIDTRTDIYSLGVLLYELLTGSRPFDSESLRQTISRCASAEVPPKPSTRLSGLGDTAVTTANQRRTKLSSLIGHLRGDLDCIMMMAIEKDRTCRYNNISELVDDIARHLNHEPVKARPPNVAYRLEKFARRNKGLVAAVIGIIAGLSAGVAIATHLYVQAEGERQRAVEAEEQQARERELAEKARDDSDSVIEYLTEWLSSVDPEKQGINVTLREMLDEAAETIGEQFADRPLIEARLRNTIGWTYRRLGLYDKAEAHLTEAAVLQRRERGPRHPDTLSALNNLATVSLDRGDYTAAVALHKATLDIQRRVLGEEHKGTLVSMNNLANALRRKGKYAEAEALHRKTLAIERRIRGEAHPRTLMSRNNLAVALRNQGKYAEAETLQRETLVIKRRDLGEEHPDTLGEMNNLANTVSDHGKYEEAEALYRKTLEIRQRILGEEHPDTLSSMVGVGIALRRQGKYAEAEALHRKTLEIERRVLGEEHPDTVMLMNNLAATLDGQGKYAAAEALHRKTLEIERRVLGEEHPSTLILMNNLAAALGGQGKYAEAQPLFLKALEISRRVWGEEHPKTLSMMNNLASVHNTQGRYADAEALHRKTLDILRSFLGVEHPDTLVAMEGLLYALNAQDKSDEARALAEELIEYRHRRAEDPQASTTELNQYASLLVTCEPKDLRNPRKALLLAQEAVEKTEGNNYVMLRTLAMAFQMTGDINRAVETQREALGLLPLDPTHIRIELEGKLGEFLFEQGKFAEAEPLLLASHKTLTEREYVRPDALRDVLERIVNFYEAWNVKEPGNGYAEKASQFRKLLTQKPPNSSEVPLRAERRGDSEP